MDFIKIGLLFGSCIMFFQNITVVESNNYVILSKVKCVDMNSKYISSWECYKTSRNRTTQLFTVNASIQPNMVLDNLFVQIVLHYKYNDYQKFLIDQLEDLCGFINGTTKAPLINMLWGEIRTHGTISHNCPFLPSEGVIIKDIRFIETPFPALPSGEFRVDLRILSKKFTNTLELVGTAQVYFIIKPKRSKTMSVA